MIYLKSCPNCIGGDIISSAYDDSMKCLQCAWTPKPAPMPPHPDSNRVKYG